MRPNRSQVDKMVDLAQQVIARDVAFKAEAIEQRLLHHPPLAHHRPNLPLQTPENQRSPRSSRVFRNNNREDTIRSAPWCGGVDASRPPRRQLDKARAAAVDCGYRAGAGPPSTVATAPGRECQGTRKNAPQNGARGVVGSV